jgi:hypothetical protein
LPTLKLLFIALLFEHLIAPIAIFVVVQHPDALGWIQKPTLTDAVNFAELFTGDGGIWLFMAYLGLCAVACFTVLSEKDRWGVRLLLLWMLLPPVIVFAASFLKPMFDARYLVMCVPALVILAARGIVPMWDMPVVRYWAAPVALAAVILLSVSGITRYFRHNDLGDWRTAVSYIADRTKPGDGAIFWIPDTHSYSYYARGRAVPDVLYPDDPWHPLSLEEIANITSARTRVWLILYGEADDPDQVSFLKSSLTIDFHLQKEQTVSAQYPITIALYERRSPVAAE